jgi:CrcB protein
MRFGLALLAVAAGGALGSAARFAVGTWFAERLGPGFPWGTLTINVTGSFLIGVVVTLATARTGFGPYMRVFLATGVLGGYTTFSTFAYETYAFGVDGLYARGAAYAFGSLVAGVLAAYAGVVAGRLAAGA